MLIRNAVLEDAATIAKIHIEAWQTAYKNILPNDYLTSLSVEVRTKQWQDALTNDNIGNNIVLESNNTIYGFCVYGSARDSDLKNKKIIEILAINISPDSWGKGYGTALIKYVIATARSNQKENIYLWVIKQNQRARKLYEFIGFEFEGSEKKDTELCGSELQEVRYVLKL